MVDLKFFNNASVRIQGFQNRLLQRFDTNAKDGQPLGQEDQTLFVLCQMAVAQQVMVDKLFDLETKLEQMTPVL